jgi:hypothetical protein
MALTQILWRANSIAVTFANDFKAALLALYTDLFCVPCVALNAKIKITDESSFKSSKNFCTVKNAP